MSKIVFKKVILDSFLSYDHEEVSITKEGVVLLSGRNLTDSKSESNGSGKSALLSDSIIWCLTGYTPRGSKEVSNQYLDRGAYVTVEFTKDNTEYIVSRGTPGSLIGNSVNITIDGTNVDLSKNDSSKFLESNLSELTWDKLTSIVILSQGLSGAMSKLKPTDRKKHIETLAGVEETYKQLSDTIQSAKVRIYDKKSELDKNISRCNGSVSSTNMMITELTNNLQKISESNKLLISEDRAIKKEQLSTSYKILVSTLEKDKKDLELADSNRLSWSTTYTEKSNEYSRLYSEWISLDNQVKSLERDIFNNKSKLESVKSEIMTTKSGVCDKCCQVLPLETMRHLLEKLDNDLKLLVDKIIQDTNTNNQYSPRLVELKSTLDLLKVDVDNLSNTYNKYNNDYLQAKSKVSSTETQLNQVKSEMRLYEKDDQVDEEPYRLQIEEISRKLTEYTVERDKYQSEIDLMSNDVTIIDWLNSRLSRDLRSFLLSGVISFLCERCKEYSNYLFDNQVVSLKIEGSKINIYLGTKIVEGLSGGESRRVDMIVQLALRDLVLVDTGFSSNILIIDEALDYLDNLGISAVLDLLISQKDSIDSLYVITHKLDADITYDSHWLVEKSDNISRRVM